MKNVQNQIISANTHIPKKKKQKTNNIINVNIDKYY